MAIAKMTLLGMQQFLSQTKTDLWSQVNFPEGIDKETAKESILLRAGEFPVIYTNPYFMIEAMGSWAMKNQLTFSRWIKALSVDYNPLDNYDRQERWTDNGRSSSAMDTESTQSVTGYDSDQLRTNAGDKGKTSSAGESGAEHEGRIHGNIGVTTSAQMLEGDTGFYKTFNLYEQIAELFIGEFCIPVY